MKWVCWTWQPWARPGNSLPFSCEIADISGYFVAKLLVPDEICLSDGSSFLLALSKLTSQPQGEITASTETPSLWDIECMSIATGKKWREGEKERRRKRSNNFLFRKESNFNPQYGFGEFMLQRCCQPLFWANTITTDTQNILASCLLFWAVLRWAKGATAKHQLCDTAALLI